MTLREQIDEIARTRVSKAFAEVAFFSEMVDFLAAKAFMYQWPESWETRAIRRASLLLERPGYVSEAEPAVE